MAVYQFYIHINHMEHMKKTYKDMLNDMNQVYEQLEKDIQNLQDSQAWQGESFQVFIDKYERWKMKLLMSMNCIVVLYQFLDELISCTYQFISERERIGT